ncbi:hypothetical protein Tco_0324474 [Tanacetum coccineum]
MSTFYTLKGRVPAERLIPDEVKAGSGWWLSSRAYFDGCVTERERRPPHLNRENHYEVPSDIYREFQEQRSGMDQMMKQGQNIVEAMKKYMEELNVDTRSNREPIIADQHYGLSDLSGFQSIQGGPSPFQTPTNNPIFNTATPTNWQTSMPSQPGSSNWHSQMPVYTPTPNWQPPNPSHPGDDGLCDPIIEKEIALAKGWRAISENSERGNTRKKVGFWVEVMEYIESKTKQEGRRTYDMVVGKWKVVRPAVGSSKMHKSSGSSSFNAKSGDASINLNNTVDDEDDMQEIRRPKGRDKAKDTAKNKGSKASGSSTMNDDALARLMVTEMTAKEVAQREKFMELKRREVECREREIAAAVYRAQQEDMRSWNEARVRHASLKTDSPSVSQGTTFKAVVQPEEKIFDYQSCFVLCNGAPSLHLLFEDPFYSPSGLHKEK